MLINKQCERCTEKTKKVVGWYDGERGKYGCIYACENERCPVRQIIKAADNKAIQERIKIQNLNGQKAMYAGYIAALRKDAKITMMKMSQVVGCSPAEYSSYEHERKEFDPEIYQKCEKYLKEKVKNDMAKCKKCGAYCRDHYTYCRKCYFKLGQPYGKAIERAHKCRKCGVTIHGRYSYCFSCADRKGFLNHIGKMQ